MGRHLNKNSEKQQSLILSGLSSIVCLVALLVHLYLPLVHQYEHILEGFTASTGGEKQAEFQIGAPESQHQDHNHHDAATCPVCQAALNSRHFTVTTPLLSPILTLPVQRFCETASTPIVDSPDILTSGPRAPPTCL